MNLDATVPNDSNKAQSRWQKLSPEKKFGLIALVSLGSALYITGRTARAVTKRIPKFTGQPTGAVQPSSLPTKAIDSSHSHPISNPHLELDSFERDPSVIKPLSSSAETLTPTIPSFWDNRSILCVKDREDDEEKEINFNPGLDAAYALGIATLIVVSTAWATIKVMGNKWELENWEDWRMFIQGGHLGPMIIPEGWQDWARDQIPQSLRLSVKETGSETHPENDSDQLDWRQRLDNEWKEEMIRREVERKEWVTKREMNGKRIW